MHYQEHILGLACSRTCLIQQTLIILCFTVQILYPTVGTYWKLNPSKFLILSWCFWCAMEDSYFWNYYTKFQTPPSVPETAVNQVYWTGTETMLWQYEDDIYHTLFVTKLQGICLHQLLQHLQACTPLLLDGLMACVVTRAHWTWPIYGISVCLIVMVYR